MSTVALIRTGRKLSTTWSRLLLVIIQQGIPMSEDIVVAGAVANEVSVEVGTVAVVF